MQRVSDSDWRTVPQAERDKMDQIYAADLVHAQAEEKTATAAYAAAQKAPAAKPIARKPAAGDDNDRAKAEVLAEIDTQQAALREATLAWRKHRAAAAHVHVDRTVLMRELARARAVDAHTQGANAYDTTDFQRQWADANESWWKANNMAMNARARLDHASAKLASAKEAYTQLTRSVPSDSDNAARLRLSGWGITSNDARRGFKITSMPTDPKTRFTPESWREIGIGGRSSVALRVR